MIPVIHEGHRMRIAREAAGLEVRDIAARIGISTSTVVSYEKGRTSVKPLARRAWAEVTGVPVQWLQWGMTEAPTQPPVLAVVEASVAKLPRLDSNQQPAGYGTLHPRQAAGVVTDLGSKRERAARVQRLRLEGGAAA